MKQLKRLTALLLCILMVFPAQGIAAIAETGTQTRTLPLETEDMTRINELVKLEPIESDEEAGRINELMELEPLDGDRIQVTLPLQPMQSEDYIIYWNPGGSLPEELADATASDATVSDATASDAAVGKDTADGRSPKTPVKTLNAAIERAHEWMEDEGAQPSDMIIYAMNPMEIADGELYVLNGGNIRIVAWPERSYQSDVVFYINGGQLTLTNTIIEGRDAGADPDMTKLIYVRGGVLQMGQNIIAEGQIILDYRTETEVGEWEETATASDAEEESTTEMVARQKQAGTASFYISDYILDTDEDSLELLRDSLIDVSTWKEPIIELLEGFGGGNGEYLLDVRMDEDSISRELVRTLYADEVPADEFLDYFVLAEAQEQNWQLEVQTHTAEELEDAELADEADIAPMVFAMDTLTQKTLIANRAGNGTVIYWNPGGPVTASGITYREGKDTDGDGSTPYEPFKTWAKSVTAANGGTVICMQPITLGTDAEQYFGAAYVNGSTFTLRSNSLENIVTLTSWAAYERPAIVVPSGTKLVLDTVILEGTQDDVGEINDTMTVHVDGGEVRVENHVTAESGYIQIDVDSNLKDRPVVVNSVGLADDGNVTLFFGGINNNLNYRYVDVVVPSAELDGQYAEENKADLGDALLGRFDLHRANKVTIELGGSSKFSWTLRKDTIADENKAEPQKLELYTQYYYDAIYLNGSSGNDDYLGATCESPVKTWQRAKELWLTEMANSIAARTAANGFFEKDEIDLLYPLPKTIYICGTVTVDDVQEWNLSEVQTDYDGSVIKTEILSHVDNKDGSNLLHPLPEALVHVVDDGKLIFGTNMFIRNFTDQPDSATVLVEGTGEFKLTDNAALTGEKLKADNKTVDKATTLGIHVHAKDGAAVTLDAGWNGVIEKRGHGLWLDGATTTATMAGGSIQNNNSFNQVVFDADGTQKPGSGAVVQNGARFTMTGGQITGNSVFQYGGGVYLGEGSSFVMSGGEITGNKMSRQRTRVYSSNTIDTYVIGYGMGIYAQENTTIEINNGTINKNTAFIADGVGIWSDGVLKIHQSSVSENYTIGYSHNNINRGIGINVAENGLLQMTESEIKGNYGLQTDLGNTRGAGIHILSTKDNYINDSTITGNLAGNENSNSFDAAYRQSIGGGICMDGSRLTITNTVIDGNRAMYGGGLIVIQASSDEKMLTIKGGSVSNNHAQGRRHTGNGDGGGIYAYSTYLRIEDTVIEGNYSRGNGGGVTSYTNGRLEMAGSAGNLLPIRNNTAYASGGGVCAHKNSIATFEYVDVSGNKAQVSNGGGIYSGDYSVLTVTDSEIYNNYAYNVGGAICSPNASDKATITNTNVINNEARLSGGGIYLRGINVLTDVVLETNKSGESGGGIVVHDHSTLTRVFIRGNTATRNGGGIYNGGGDAVGKTGLLTIKDSEITGNETTGTFVDSNTGRGGGLLNWGGGRTTILENVIFHKNKAVTGGGIANNGINLSRNLVITENEAVNGGGIMMWDQNYFLTESKVEDNKATENGGGFYVSNGNNGFFFTEKREEGKFSSFTGNSAGANGGGIYMVSGGIRFDIIGDVRNTAGVQGSNIYTTKGGGFYINGNFKQPVPATADGVHNVYVNVTTSNVNGMYLDPSKVKIERKTGSSPDAIFLYAGSSYLTYLDKPDVNTPDMPISLNKETFEVGSIVIKPSNNITYVDNYRPTADMTAYESYRTPYDGLKDASTNLEYNTEGTLPRRTTLSGYVDSVNNALTNVVLVGEGVYLDGENGNDDNNGLTPQKAVKTMAGAKVRLAEHINNPTHQNDDGFVPFIYICGTVTIPENEPVWELDYDDSLFLVNNAKYIESETDLGEPVHPAQVRRFASFIRYQNGSLIRPMVRIGNDSDQAHLEMGKIIIDGMAEAVITAEQAHLSPMIEMMNGSELTLNDWSQLRNNYFYGVIMRDQTKLTMNGEAPITGEPHEEDKNKQLLNMHGQFIRFYGAATVEMNGYSRILTDGYARRLWTDQYIRGIYSNGYGSAMTIHMNDYSSITNLPAEDSEVTIPLRINRGVDIEGSYVGKKEIHLTGHAKIENLIYYGGGSTWGIRAQGGADSNVLMKDDAQIVNNDVQYGIHFGADYTAADEQAGKSPLTITLVDQAYIETANSGGRGIETHRTKAIITMATNAKIKANEHGIVSSAATTDVTMTDFANINARSRGIHMYSGSVTMSDETFIKGYGDTPPSAGIWSESANTFAVTLKDQAAVYATTHGIRTRSSVSTDIMLRDYAQIDVLLTNDNPAGIFFYESGANTINVMMRDYAKITATNRPVFFHTGSGTFTMNDPDDPTDDGYATVISRGTSGHGIWIGEYARNARVIMNKNALIQGNGTNTVGTGGFLFSSYNTLNSVTDTVPNYLEMNDNSRITGYYYGIYLHKAAYPIEILMQDDATVDQNRNGMVEKNETGDRIMKLNLVMKDQARISGNMNYGVYLSGQDNFVKDSTGYHRITLNDSAVIGGDSPYDAGDPASGNGYTGIYATSPLDVTLNDNSHITGNGYSGTTVATKQAIYLSRYNDSRLNYMQAYYRTGESTVTLNQSSYIAGNQASIYVTHGKDLVVSDVTYRFGNESVITLNGAGATPAIRDNGAALYAGDDTTVKMIGTSKLAMTDSSKVLESYGHLELDGRSLIDGQVHLYTPENPITMTNPVNDITKRYHLYLAEGFLGKVVVQPDGTGMTDVAPQLPYFVKDGADGLAEPKRLMDEAPNIILEGENHVYLSGSGNDANNGNSPATAVRTFKRAKELLETGYFRDGANIIITTTTVTVLPDDLNWSFDNGGTVTNTHPKGGQTWTPLVIREKSFTGRMVTVDSTTGGQVVFSHITLDGGSAEGTVLTTTSAHEVLLVNQNGKALLGEGAVLQNNYVATTIGSEGAPGILVANGKLDIDGAIIQNMVKETTTSKNDAVVASAIYIRGDNATYPAEVNFKSGQIKNNQIKAPLVSGNDNTRFGTIAMYHRYATLNMSGGVISDNMVETHPTSGTGSRGGALYFWYSHVEISGGTIRNNTGGQGSAIFYEGDKTGGRLVMSGGQIIDNRTNAPNNPAVTGAYSPVYIKGWYFQLKGGSADIRDNIYLHDVSYKITLSGVIYQKERVYQVYLNTGSYSKGAVVVQPDKVWLSSAASYLNNFEIHTNSYILDRGQLSTAPIYSTVSGVKENECLILMKAVYLDYDKGLDSRNGTTPSLSVKTFTRAKALGVSGGSGTGVNYYVIYLSGRAVNTSTAAESSWSLPATAYMCRYTGFTVYNADGTPDTGAAAYHDYLIEPAYNLTLDGIRIYGRRSTDTTTNNGNSMIHVKENIQVVMKQSDAANATYLGRNYNIGEYTPPGGSIISLDSRGGAFRVEDKGSLRIEGGTIADTDATYGGAVYLEAASADRGRMHITGSPAISGSVYLSGSGITSAAFIETDQNYKPSSTLLIAVGNDYNSRNVVEYTDESAIGDTQYKYYAYEDSLKALYDIVVRGDKDNFIRLNLKKAYYLDGQTTNPTKNGLTPETAFSSIREVYEAIDADVDQVDGYLIYIVDTVDITASDQIVMSNIEIKIGTTSVYEGTYSDGAGPDISINGQVYFKRYAKPSGYTTEGDDAPLYVGFNKKTNLETLFHIEKDGALTLNGIYVDGHSVESIGDRKTVVADAVEALSPLITVENEGTLSCGYLDETTIVGGIRTNTKLVNNKNIHKKTNIIGHFNGADIAEGTGGGIELLGGTKTLPGGKAILKGTEFANLELGTKIAGGEDVYSNGDLHFANQTLFSGTVYLEGFGTAEADHETSRYLTVDLYGTPVKIDFQVLMRDPYNLRTVIYHAPEGSGPGDESQIGRYRLEERVKEFFKLNKRAGKPYIYELQLPPTVYIGGPNATDSENDTVAGSTPENPVKSLRRAFQLLKTRGGSSIYVVGTIEVDTNVYITGNTYEGDDEPGGIFLGSTNQVKFVRYIQPDFAYDDPQAAIDARYNVTDYTGVMMNVKEGYKAVFSDNVIFDGHSQMKVPDPGANIAYPEEIKVSRITQSMAPMITVEKGATLELLNDTVLKDNDNKFNLATETAGAEMNGGVLYNSGTAVVDGALFANNHAVKASGVYQDGTFTIKSAPGNLRDHTFYLTHSNTEDHIIRTEAAMPDDLIFDVDMDHAVKGRDVVKFLDPAAYDPDVDSEHVHFRLGSTVPTDLFLVEAENDPTVLELQNWEILKVEVPTDIYLAVTRKGSLESTTKLRAVIDDPAVGTDLFTAPEYAIRNKGNYDAKVSISGFENKTAEAGITADLMNLTASAGAVSAANDLYLAVKGMDDTSAGTGFDVAETSLQAYSETPVIAAPLVLGTLKSKTDGNFTFIGAVGNGFVDKYMDATFPVDGVDKADVQDYMDGNAGGTINARAKYLLKYKVEIVPPRR